MKKSVFGLLNYLLPAKGVMPMHCSAKIGANGDTAGVVEPVAAGAAAFGNSGIGFSDGVGATEGVGARVGGCVGWGWRLACGCTGTAYAFCGVIGCW